MKIVKIGKRWAIIDRKYGEVIESGFKTWADARKEFNQILMENERY